MTGQGQGREISFPVKPNVNPLRTSLIDALTQRGVTPDYVADKIRLKMDQDDPHNKVLECYMRLIGAYQGVDRQPNIGKFAQIIQLPGNQRAA
jgi:hypothetical protein